MTSTTTSTIPAPGPNTATVADTANTPDVTLTIIERRTGWRALDLRDVWRYRELLYFFTWRDVKVRYKQTAFGAAWAVAKPFASMIVFSVLFGRLVGLDRQTGDIPYPVFVFAGLLPWNLFASSMGSAGNSVVSSAGIITKIYFPRLLLPVASVGVSLVDFVIAFFVLIGMMLWYGVTPGPELLLLPVLMGLIVLAALSIGIWLAALTVTYRDFTHVVPFLIQIWMYLTPVIYPVSIVPERFHWLLALNPMTGLVDGFRYCLLGQPLEWTSLAIGSTLTITTFLASIFYFRRTESKFADIV